MPDPARTLDLCGLPCPLPVFHARDALFDLAEGAVLEVLADDPQAPTDFEKWCPRNGHRLLGITMQGPTFIIRIQKGPERARAPPP